uniref:RRP15-like protein n=1 Tax=Caligus clemensi TaxID=344056 RepID=C1C024_CALCM|nr:RRP15-like protein [Caligus clemensi]
MKSKVIQNQEGSEVPLTEPKADESEDMDDFEAEYDVDSGEDTDADDEGDNNELEDDEGDEEEGDEKSGWADAMAKVLKSAKASGPTQVVLSKARKDSEVKSKIIPEGKSEEKTEVKVPPPSKLKQSVIRSRKLALESIGRQKPHVVRDKVKEKSLNKIATKGVVQLFNAVKKQQVDLKKELTSVGKSIRKTEKVYQSLDKESFLESVLGAKSHQKTGKHKEEIQKPQEETMEEPMDLVLEESCSKNWSVLRDDFMIGAKMKDWDKNSDSEG